MGLLPVVGQQVVAMSLSGQFWVVFSLLFEPKKQPNETKTNTNNKRGATMQCSLCLCERSLLFALIGVEVGPP